MQFDEIDLIKKAQKGEKVAFSTLYNYYYPKIFGYIVRRVGVVQTAADITSETFLKMLKKINTFKFVDIPFSAWLYRVATNEITNFYRQKKMRSLEQMQEETGFEVSDKTDLEEEFNNAQEELRREKIFVEIATCLGKLPLHYQEVIALRFFEKKKTREIADILGKSEGTIKSLLSRGIEKLKKEMEMKKS